MPSTNPFHTRGDKMAFSIPKCFFCRKDKNEIVMNTTLSAGIADKVAEMHGKIVDMSPCQECRGWMDRGIILISVKDGEKMAEEGWSPDPTKGPAGMVPPIPNPYRTGGWTVITEDGFIRTMEGMKADQHCIQAGLRHRWMFVEDTVWCAIGLPKYAAGQQVTLTKEVLMHDVDHYQPHSFNAGQLATVIAEDGRWVFISATFNNKEYAEAVLQTALAPIQGVPPAKVDTEKFHRIVETVKGWHTQPDDHTELGNSSGG